MHKMIKYTVVFRDIISYQHFSRLQIVVSGITFSVFLLKKCSRTTNVNFQPKEPRVPIQIDNFHKVGCNSPNENEF